MYQIGALAALEDVLDGFEIADLDLFIGTSSGASVAAALAGGGSPRRIYRAFLDPADVYFPLERKHILRIDFSEWWRTASSLLGTLRHSSASILSRGSAAKPAELWEEVDRLFDTLPAGFFSLERYERFLEDFFIRRDIPNSFGEMPRTLRVMAYDLDSGKQVLFGSEDFEHVPVSRACAASLAVPPFFSPLRIGERHYIDAGAAQNTQLDVAVEHGAELLIVVNPMVPVRALAVPTGHGRKHSLRSKGLFWVMNQSIRIGMHRLMLESCARIESAGVKVLLVEPEGVDAALFMHNPASFAARRLILEDAYRRTRAKVGDWQRQGILDKLGLRAAQSSDG